MQKQLTVAAIVLALAVTPSWIDVAEALKNEEGEGRDRLKLAVLLWYLVLTVLALSSWRMFDAKGG